MTERASLGVGRFERLEKLAVAAEARSRVPYDWHDETKHSRDEIEQFRAVIVAFVDAVDEAKMVIKEAERKR